MKVLISLSLIFFGFYLLYLTSEKQNSKTLKTSWKWCAENRKYSKIIAFGLFIFSITLLCVHFGIGIGSVSFFILATPLIFIIILYCNDLKQKNVAKAKK
jgi:uncharacterized membrane protein YfcA